MIIEIRSTLFVKCTVFTVAYVCNIVHLAILYSTSLELNHMLKSLIIQYLSVTGLFHLT